jgi:hypothetical protein
VHFVTWRAISARPCLKEEYVTMLGDFMTGANRFDVQPGMEDEGMSNDSDSGELISDSLWSSYPAGAYNRPLLSST